MELFNVFVVFLTMLCTGILLTVYIFYLFFMKSVPDYEDSEFDKSKINKDL